MSIAHVTLFEKQTTPLLTSTITILEGL